jgi:hypothetical protein
MPALRPRLSGSIYQESAGTVPLPARGCRIHVSSLLRGNAQEENGGDVRRALPRAPSPLEGEGWGGGYSRIRKCRLPPSLSFPQPTSDVSDVGHSNSGASRKHPTCGGGRERWSRGSVQVTKPNNSSEPMCEFDGRARGEVRQRHRCACRRVWSCQVQLTALRIVSARSVRSQEKPPSFSGARPK